MTIESLSAKLSEIVLPDFDERPMRLGSLWESQNGWVFCREHVAQLLEHEPKIKARGANLAAIGMGDFHYARLFREETGILFPLLVDVQRGACRAAELKCANLLHLLRRANAAARKRANAEGHRQNKFGENPFQLGTSFVFGPGNVDRFRHISETFGDNASIADVLCALSS